MKIYWPALRLGGLLVASAAFLPLAAGAQASKTAAPASPATSVSEVDVARSGQQTAVRVASNGDMGYHVSRLTDPPRVVVDLDDAHLSAARRAVPSDYEPVRGVRLGQYRPDRVRVVIDLLHPAEFSVEKSGHDVIVTFSEAASSAAASIVPASQSAPVAKSEARSETPASVSTKPVSAPRESRKLPLPALLTDRAAALAGPQQLPGKSAGALVAQAPAGAAAAAQQAGAPSAQRYSGEPISVNLKSVDLKDFFRLIHEISGLNVVLDPSVGGTVTLVLDEVPWDQALDIVLKNNGLSKELDGNVLRIVTQDTLRREAESQRDLAKAESEAIEPETVTRVLSYAKATEMVAPLKRFLSPRGDVVAIDRSNTLIIRDIPASMPQIDTLIRQLDRKSQQVEIQARVVQASRSFARDIGTQFGAAGGWAGLNSSNVIGGNPVAALASQIVHPTTPPLVASGNSIPLLSNFGADAPTSGLAFSHSSPNFALDYIITAAESKGVGKLLSSPQLVTQNNAQAVVKQGEQIPIQTTVNNTVSTQYVDAVLRLQVTPQITAEGTVFMDVVVENTQVDSGVPAVNGIPALATQSAQTKVLIQDGGTVVIGGVMVSQQTTNIFEVPLVGSIPLIGHLFKRTAISVSSQELLFFLTPRIMPG